MQKVVKYELVGTWLVCAECPEPEPVFMKSYAEDSIPTRQSLLVRLKRWEDAEGWREFFDRYWELLYNVARKAGLNDAEAQDVVQETVVHVARKISEFNTDPRRGSFKSWLLGQARWRIGDRFRARKREARLFCDRIETGGGQTDKDESTRTDAVFQIADPGLDQLDRAWNEEWEQHILRTALERVKAQVSVKQFQMFELHVRQGLPVGEAARAMGTTSAAIYMAKSRVGRVLKRELKTFERSDDFVARIAPRSHPL